MEFNAASAKSLLERFDFAALFVNELGWDRHSAALSIEISGTPYALRAIAEKRGMVVWLCEAPKGQSIPDRATRKKIEHQVAKTTLEHLIIFTDAKRAEQIWCWARREAGKPASVPEHFWYASSGNRGFLQKLSAIAFSLEEEESLTLVDVTSRARAAFDVERVTKRFYDQFKIEHKAFLDFISGITDVADREWYASLMLNRLMFIYFMQRKGFLNGERDYLRNRLDRCQREKGRDKFYSFYSYFLLRLFHEGLGGKKRNPDLEKLLGRIPYLNGGLFEPHPIEEQYPKIAIPDEAFTRIFAYFDRYQWHLDERPLRNDNEINPDVLGYIFEKYINQKQMGAYYTKEDITEYISKNTVIPFLFDAAKAKCKVAFENPNGPTIWDHLRDDPDRYIYAAVKQGVESPLPADIAAGVDDVSARTNWNRAAPAEFALPTEIWREVVARRTRLAEIRAKLAAGEVRDINNLITLNLDIRQFAQDVIERCEGPDLLRAFWKAIESVTILDPTCGSGAFLFAALNILEPLYEACLERMEAFVADLERSGDSHHPKKFEDFKAILAKVSAHPNTRYFILKSIVLNNLFGVDIMEEAVEICKLRLFLKLAAQVDPDPNHPNLGIEPLPDVDFNIRAGNTLVGYATYDDMLRSVENDLIRRQELETVKTLAADLQQRADAYRNLQTQADGSIPPEHKAELRERLRRLDTELDRQLAAEYGVDIRSKSKVAHETWLKSHEPFHWFVEFYGIMQRGGFDVIIGNPPYVELATVREQYETRGYKLVATGNLFSLCIERCRQLLRSNGTFGMIVPISAISTPRMTELVKFLSGAFRDRFISNYAVRPSKLFVGVDMNLSIVVCGGSPNKSRCFSTNYLRWNEEYRPFLFANLSYAQIDDRLLHAHVPKMGSPIDGEILAAVQKHQPIERLLSRSERKDVVYYHSGGRYYRKCIREKLSNEYRELSLPAGWGNAIICLLTSSLFYWYWIVNSDCYHVIRSDVEELGIPSSLVSDKRFSKLAEELLLDMWKNSETRQRRRADGTTQKEVNFYVGKSKSIIDVIDGVLAQHYGLDPIHLDYLRNYDSKFKNEG
jgi:hypothetical protein